MCRVPLLYPISLSLLLYYFCNLVATYVRKKNIKLRLLYMYCMSQPFFLNRLLHRRGCIYSTLFDAHIRLIFTRQYHINCLSIQKHVQFHICIYFRFLAVCIALIAKSICIYFQYLAVCITLIAIFCQRLAGIVLEDF